MNYSTFLDSFFHQIEHVGLDVTGLKLDHIAYQASSTSDYEKLLPEFLKLGDLASEEVISERRVAVFKLKEPITYTPYTIPALELIEPRKGEQFESGFQHAELLVPEPFEYYVDKYPQLSWDTTSMHREKFAHLKLHFENGLTLKLILEPILEQVARK